jgi:hypothetical protein
MYNLSFAATSLHVGEAKLPFSAAAPEIELAGSDRIGLDGGHFRK